MLSAFVQSLSSAVCSPTYLNKYCAGQYPHSIQVIWGSILANAFTGMESSSNDLCKKAVPEYKLSLLVQSPSHNSVLKIVE